MKASSILQRSRARWNTLAFAALLGAALFLLSLPTSCLASALACGKAETPMQAQASSQADACPMESTGTPCCCHADSAPTTPPVSPAVLPASDAGEKAPSLSSSPIPFLIVFTTEDARLGGRSVAALASAVRSCQSGPAFAASDGTAARSLLRSWVV